MRRMLTPAEAMRLLSNGGGKKSDNKRPCTEPVAKPVAEPVAKPAEPVAKLVAEPVAKVRDAEAGKPHEQAKKPTNAGRAAFVRRLTATRLSRLGDMAKLDRQKPILVGLPEDIDFAATVDELCRRLYAGTRKAFVLYACDMPLGRLGDEVALVQRRRDLDGSTYVPVLTHMWTMGSALSQHTEVASLPGPLLLVVDNMYDPSCARLRRSVTQHLFLQTARPCDLPDAQTCMAQYLNLPNSGRWLHQLVATAPTALFVESQAAFGARVESMTTDHHPGRTDLLAEVVCGTKKCAVPLHRDDVSRLVYDMHGTYISALGARHKADQLGTCSQVLNVLMAADRLGADDVEVPDVPEVSEMLANSSCLFRRYVPKETDVYYACINHLKKNAAPCQQTHGVESLTLDTWRAPHLSLDESRKLQNQLSKQCKYWALSQPRSAF